MTTPNDSPYMVEAEWLVADWIINDFPGRHECEARALPEDATPKPVLVTRRIPVADFLQMPSEGASIVVPEVHFWHEDNSLVLVRAYPIEFARRDVVSVVRGTTIEYKLTKDIDGGPSKIYSHFLDIMEGKGKEILAQWVKDGYPIHGRYTLDDGWTGMAYSLIPPSPFPLVELSHKGIHTGTARYEATSYRLRDCGRFVHQPIPLDERIETDDNI